MSAQVLGVVLLATLLGVLVFRERLGPVRTLAIVLVLPGILLMRSS